MSTEVAYCFGYTLRDYSNLANSKEVIGHVTKICNLIAVQPAGSSYEMGWPVRHISNMVLQNH